MADDLRGGFRTHWSRRGTGPDPALLLHCSLAHSGAWEGVASRLEDRLTMTAFDLPGHGRSAERDPRTEIQTASTAIAADLLDAPAHLIGHSFGGTVALRLAVEQPEKVRSLTLIEPVFFAVAKQDAPGALARSEAPLAGFAEAAAAGRMEEAARLFINVWGDGRQWEDLGPRQRAGFARRIGFVHDAHAALYDDAAGMLSSGALTRIAVPVLLIEGGDSPPVIDAVNAGLARRIPDARRVVVPGAGHMVPITHPGPVAAAIRDFLDNAAG